MIEYREGTRKDRVVGCDFLVLNFAEPDPWTYRLREQLVNSKLGQAGKHILAGGRMEDTEHYKHFTALSDKQFHEWERTRFASMLSDASHQWLEKSARLVTTGITGGKSVMSGPICLGIDDNGFFPIEQIRDGYHRLTAAALLGINPLVYVSERADGWEALRVALYGYRGKTALYHQFPHPDFQSWEVYHGDLQRFMRVGEYIKTHDLGANALDLGCCLGFQSYWLKKKGCVEKIKAIDFDPTWSLAASRLALAMGFEFERVDAESFFERYTPKGHYSCTIASNFIYHLINVYGMDRARNVLTRMVNASKCLIFDNAGEADICGFVRETLGDVNIQIIGADSEYGRDIYALEM